MNATEHLSWLKSRGYAAFASLKLVGDRFGLDARQREAVARSACSDDELVARRSTCVAPADISGRIVDVDAFNVLITLEAALAGGPLLLGRGGCLRDLANVRGTWRRVVQTRRAQELLGETLEQWEIAAAHFFVDENVPKSGELRAGLLAMAKERGWVWKCSLLPRVDEALRRSPHVVASADSGVVDGCAAWVNLARSIVESRVDGAWIVGLDGTARAASRGGAW